MEAAFAAFSKTGGKFLPVPILPGELEEKSETENQKKRRMKANKVQGVQMKLQTCSSSACVTRQLSTPAVSSRLVHH